MAHWTEKYLNLEYSEQHFDCADLLQHVLKRERGINIPLPDDRAWRKRKPESLQAFSGAFAKPVQDAKEFSGVLMKIQGNRKSVGCHVGLASIVGGQVWVLHAMESIGTIFCPVSHINRLRLELVGYYEWEKKKPRRSGLVG